MTQDVYSPRPARPLKRTLELDYRPSKHYRAISPPPESNTSSQTLARTPSSKPVGTIHSWLLNIPAEPISRPNSAPARLSECETLDILEYQPLPLTKIKQMFPSKRDSQASSQAAKPSTSHPLYRAVLLNNNIYMDLSGNKLPPEVRALINEKILKSPSSPPLPEECVREVKIMAEYLVESAEASVSSLIRTAMFPLRLPGVIFEGGDTQWATEALPQNPNYGLAVSAPKPDLHYGYAPGQLSTWSPKENVVVDHVFARPYTQPARGNKFPFLVFELKSEATGGTLWHAENQAAGSGTCCVSGLLWLLKQADPERTRRLTDSIAFSVTVTQRVSVFYVHYYVEEEQRFYMSYISKIWNTDPIDIQRCHDIVKNILEYGVTIRQQMIKDAFSLLFPIPNHWNRACDSPSTREGSRHSKTSRLGR